MTALAHTPARFEVPTFQRARVNAESTPRLRLLASGDGWSLVGADGRVVFEALGTRGRRQCLEFARARGVLVVLT